MAKVIGVKFKNTAKVYYFAPANDNEVYKEKSGVIVETAKGLEFPNVYLVGLEDGLFPGMRAIGDHEEMEEERRLCYVAITRAMKTLTICHARQRMLYGRTNAALPSRFLREIPESLIVKKGGYHSAQTNYGQYNNRTPYYNPATLHDVKKAVLSSASSVASAGNYLELNKGDMVMHTAFGKGLVLSVMKMGGDALLEIAFDQIGTKKLMAKTASAHMKRL